MDTFQLRQQWLQKMEHCLLETREWVENQLSQYDQNPMPTFQSPVPLSNQTRNQLYVQFQVEMLMIQRVKYHWRTLELLFAKQADHFHQDRGSEKYAIHQFPKCEFLRCRIYSQWISLPMDMWFLIADYAEHHLEMEQSICLTTDSMHSETRVVQAKFNCWCAKARFEHDVALEFLDPRNKLNGFVDLSTLFHQEHLDNKMVVRFSRGLHEQSIVLSEESTCQILQHMAWNQDSLWPGIRQIQTSE